MPAAPSQGGVTVLRQAARPAEHNFADRFTGASFSDRFAGAPIWDSSYASARGETRQAAYASVQAPSAALRATDAVASRAPGFQLASASTTDVLPSEPRSRSLDPGPRVRPNDIASAVAAFSEPDSKIAIYDIAAHTVYLPNGDKL